MNMDEPTDSQRDEFNSLLLMLQQNNYEQNNHIVVNMVVENRNLLVQQCNSISVYDEHLLAAYQQAMETHANESTMLAQQLANAQAELVQAYNESDRKERMVSEYGDRAYAEITGLTVQTETSNMRLRQRNMWYDIGKTCHNTCGTKPPRLQSHKKTPWKKRAPISTAYMSNLP